MPIRKNLSETAFFYPQLRTDDSGNVTFELTMPEALTEWKFMAAAHTKNMAYGSVQGFVRTQKDLMVVPNLPRFFRQGDDMVITTKISNLGNKDENGAASLQILDAASNLPLNQQFKLETTETGFTVKTGQSSVASWTIHIPANQLGPVIVRVSAATGDFTDGEENTLPVISNRTLVTETLPLCVNGNRQKSFRMDKLIHSDTSSTLTQHALTLEYTSNPAWYAILALPYLAEFPYECAEQTFNRYFSYALAGFMTHISPAVEQTLRKWQKEDTTTLISNLDKNPELKSTLLQETPWVMEAKSETEQRRRLMLLFQAEKMKRSMKSVTEKLKDMQLPSGGFPWFKGDNEDRYITQYIVSGIGRLKHLGVDITDKDLDEDMDDIADNALVYLDQEMRKEFVHLLKIKADTATKQLDNEGVQYLYLRSFFADDGIPKDCRQAYDYWMRQAKTYQATFGNFSRGMIALALFRAGDRTTPVEIVASLKELAHHSDEMGMYWKNRESYMWFESPVESQALLVECFTEVAKDGESVDAMKIWLLKQKQTQNWPTTRATADACYALLLNGAHLLEHEPSVSIQLGDESIKSTDLKTGSGGYFCKRYEAGNVKPAMGNVKVDVHNSQGASWGAAYWQYFENLDKISSAATPVAVTRHLYINRDGVNGPELEPLNARNVLKIGDKVTVRLEITADRDMDYVHLKDMRPACFEPIHVISDYKYQDGLGYYEATKDASTNFFISHLPKGKYVLEYPVYVTHSGDFSGGFANLQCMYAPEFSSHSEGMRVKVGEP